MEPHGLQPINQSVTPPGGTMPAYHISVEVTPLLVRYCLAALHKCHAANTQILETIELLFPSMSQSTGYSAKKETNYEDLLPT